MPNADGCETAFPGRDITAGRRAAYAATTFQQVMFVTFHVPVMFVAIQGVLSLCSLGRTTASCPLPTLIWISLSRPRR